MPSASPPVNAKLSKPLRAAPENPVLRSSRWDSVTNLSWCAMSCRGRATKSRWVWISPGIRSVRWQHADLGLVPPAQFITIAEETGLIVPIGEWVLNTARATQHAWQQHGLPQIMMPVNRSPRQFLYGDLVGDMIRLFARPGHAAAGLKLEITEGMVMQNPKRAVLPIRTLKEMGLHIAIDDFGTGYSSLAYLRRFPIDTLKIDRSFILNTPADAGAVAITQAIIAMAHSLGLDVTAEGVETAEQFEFLLQHGCDQMQGYYFSPPLSETDAAALLGRQKKNGPAA